ncbi:MAG: hypothetical protein KAV87_47840 [Desulfobacteraceae bacterium]|nr:hypothetical protein [Desulfobacteraceae bacterium]
MPINYSIQADVVEVISDDPLASDVFLIDSNVWYWMTYSNASVYSFSYQLSDYPQYVNKALKVGAHMCHTGLSLAELSHLIEKTEHKIYKQAHGEIFPKEYRHNLQNERTKVAAEVQAAWVQITRLAAIIDVVIDNPTTSAALTRFQTEKLDGYDIFILEAMGKHGLIQVISDDGDFATIAGIQVFTSNRNVIQAAQAQGRLSVR